MDFKFNDKDLSIVAESTTHNEKNVKCRVTFDGVEHLYTAEINKDKNNAKLAFELASQIANEALGMDCDPSDFTLPMGGHMVIFGEYDSWGTHPEDSKSRVKSNNFNKVADVEFYLRHALLAVEYSVRNIKRQPASLLKTLCL